MNEQDLIDKFKEAIDKTNVSIIEIGWGIGIDAEVMHKILSREYQPADKEIAGIIKFILCENGKCEYKERLNEKHNVKKGKKENG